MTDNVVEFDKKEEEKVELSPADKALTDAIGKFSTTLVIGIDEHGKFGFYTSQPNYAFMQYALTRSAFELSVMERNQE